MELPELKLLFHSGATLDQVLVLGRVEREEVVYGHPKLTEDIVAAYEWVSGTLSQVLTGKLKLTQMVAFLLGSQVVDDFELAGKSTQLTKLSKAINSQLQLLEPLVFQEASFVVNQLI